MTKKFLFIVSLVVLTAISGAAQNSPPVSLETILSEAEKQSLNYREEFKNLLAEETKTFQDFDKKGQLKDKTVVESTFLVYQSPKNKNASAELRNVLKVDGKLLPDSQQRADQLLAELHKTTTYQKELERIQKEGSRYDKTLDITGLTLFKGIPLAANLRPFFDYKFLGTENYQGNETYIVGYQQTRKSPFIAFNETAANPNELRLDFKIGLPGKLKKAEALLRGKLWIDAKTFQIRREERELTVLTPEPVVLLQTNLTYQPSDYGIFVPKEISLVSNNLKKSNKNQYTAVNDTKITFDYSNFRKTDVDVKILDDDQ